MKNFTQKTRVLSAKGLCMLFLGICASIWGLQGQNVVINGNNTTGGQWSELIDETYTFIADGGVTDVVITNTDITNRLNGTGTTAGNVLISATGNINVGTTLTANNDNSNQAYTLTLDGNNIIIGGEINLKAKDGGQYTSNAHSLKAIAQGNIEVQRAINLSGGHVINSPAAGGQGGTCTLTAGNDVLFNNNSAQISVEGGRGADNYAGGNIGGDGGSILIQAGGGFVVTLTGNALIAKGGNGGGVNADGRQKGGDAGTISIVVDSISVSSNFRFEARGGSNGGNGGNISMHALNGNIVLAGNGQINAQGENHVQGPGGDGGNGGNVSLIADNGYVKKLNNGDIIVRGENGKTRNGDGGTLTIFGDKGVTIGAQQVYY